MSHVKTTYCGIRATNRIPTDALVHICKECKKLYGNAMGIAQMYRTYTDDEIKASITMVMTGVHRKKGGRIIAHLATRSGAKEIQ